MTKLQQREDHGYKNFDDEKKKEMRIKSLRFKKTNVEETHGQRSQDK